MKIQTVFKTILAVTLWTAGAATAAAPNEISFGVAPGPYGDLITQAIKPGRAGVRPRQRLVGQGHQRQACNGAPDPARAVRPVHGASGVAVCSSTRLRST